MQNKYLITYMFKNNKVEMFIEASSSVEVEQKVMYLTDGQADVLSIEMRDVK